MPQLAGNKTNKPKKLKSKVSIIAYRSILSFFTLLIILAVAILGICMVFCYGPSETAKNKFVSTTNEMSAMRWLAPMLLGQEEVDGILSEADSTPGADSTDPSLVVIGDEKEDDEDKEFYEKYPDDDNDGIILVKINRKYYSGWLMMVRDPSRVYVSTSADTFPAQNGLRIKDALARENAVAATNAGGFPDAGGSGNGGCPNSLVISKGQVKWKETVSNGEKQTTIGFTKDNVLFVGDISISESINMGLRDAVRWGPAIIVNGEVSPFQEESSSINPRTAIGQRADGTVLLLVIDGRQTSSLGATFSDIADIMIEFGAVNAGNLDGGSSTSMFYNGEEVNNCAAVWGARKMPTYIMVSQPK